MKIQSQARFPKAHELSSLFDALSQWNADDTTYPRMPNSRSSGSDNFHIGRLLPQCV